jgi:hypothetical protein
MKISARKATKALSVASKEVGLEVNAKKTGRRICAHLMKRTRGKIATQIQAMNRLKM